MTRIEKQLAFQLACLQVAAFGKNEADVRMAKKVVLKLANDLGLPNPAGFSAPAIMEMAWDQLLAETASGPVEGAKW